VFVRLSNSRVNKAIESIRLIGNLSNRANYTYEPSDVDAIIGALKAAVSDCKQRFDASSSATPGKNHFKLE